MTAETAHVAPDRERAETYLRLQAEAELRHALTMPEYKQPRERLPMHLAGVIMHRQRMRRRRARIDRLMRQQGSGSTAASSQIGQANPSSAKVTAALPVLRHAAKSLASVRTVVAAPTAMLRRSSRTAAYQLIAPGHGVTWRLNRRFRHRNYQPPPAEASLRRVQTLASVLAAVGAITAQTEEEVVDGLRAAMAARSRIEQDEIFGYNSFHGHRMRRRTAATAAPSGPPRAVPVGASANGEIAGVPIRFYLGVLVFRQRDVTLTVRARFPEELLDDDDRMDPVFEALNEIRAVDDQGGTYRTHFSGGGGGGEWDGRLHLSPAPPAAVRWLDMTLPGAPAARVHLDAAPRKLRITTEPATANAADRLLDAQTMRLLSREPAYFDWPSDDDRDMSDDDSDTRDDDRDLLPLFRMASHLVAAGVLGCDSPSLGRLVAAAAQLGTRLPDALAAVEPVDLPADWLSLLSRAGCTDGPTGAIPVAVVLPEVDGVQCVIVDLVSDAESATLQVHARGWPRPRDPFGVRSGQIWLSGRDDLGGRYVINEGSSSYGDDEADLGLEISPPINPQARVLDIILAGTTTQVTVSVPLDWREAL